MGMREPILKTFLVMAGLWVVIVGGVLFGLGWLVLEVVDRLKA